MTAPEVVRSWIQRIERMCSSGFSIDVNAPELSTLNEYEKHAEIHRRKWIYMLENKKDSCFITPIVELLEPTKFNQFAWDVALICSIISEKIHKAEYDSEDDIPQSYYYFYVSKDPSCTIFQILITDIQLC